MPEPTATTIVTDDATTTAVPTADVAVTATLKPGQLPADACPEPTMTMEDFLAKAKADGMPLNMPEATLQARKTLGT
ncbi:hypothetical protein BGZ91_012165 [Linnemannia elongata]|nr:hypothetical protein BGZ91_012165 [Linnemannia elongata]KAG0076961.1 hypothetical protein BGZ90_007955 [Linnemannia elongata]